MAIIENNILGKISGKLGNMVFYERNGKTVIKSLPSKSSTPPSAKQLYQRAAFKIGQQFLTPLRAELEIGFAKSSLALSQGFNRALSVILKTAILNEGGNPVLYPEKVKISEGDLLGVEIPAAQWIGGNLLEIAWVPNAFMGHAKEADRLFVVAYDPDSGRKWAIIKGNYRKTGSQQIQFPWSGELQGRFYIYLSFFAEVNRGKEFSDSVCLGRV
ncbi:DUF6266 family protein [Algoriphagus sp. D3-2-R+10]|uniref:DUF6266 family protein n=1 Tax=Algoriphagus aurantiacus TaxID=3103948 RepID=UPI002B3D6B7C|nr:DUF6266 family protein [Algoriphagus sp. D3-2-R+10]MEB2778494.1 DUF6266 family protein [Algoriphagus sp. D3-2-R+10]